MDFIPNVTPQNWTRYFHFIMYTKFLHLQYAILTLPKIGQTASISCTLSFYTSSMQFWASPKLDKMCPFHGHWSFYTSSMLFWDSQNWTSSVHFMCDIVRISLCHPISLWVTLYLTDSPCSPLSHHVSLWVTLYFTESTCISLGHPVSHWVTL